MITSELLETFLDGAGGQALREGTRYAREARVGDLVGSGEGVSTVVRGLSSDYETVLWVEGERLEHRCSCPSWRDPCKHEVAAALVLKQCLPQTVRPAEIPAVSDDRSRETGAVPGAAKADPID